MKMKTIAAAALCCLSAAATAGSAAPLRSFPTPQIENAKASSPAFQADALHDGFVSDPKLEPPLEQKWTYDFSAAPSYPVVAGGLVFIASGSTLFALKATTGNVVWSAQAPSGAQAWVGAAYDSGIVFAQAEYAFSYQPSLFALQAKNGKVIWSASLPGQYAFSSPPVAGNGLVYTGGAGSGGTVYALAEKTGKPVWTAEVENGDDSAPVVTASDVYVSYACPQTYDFKAATGQPVWHFQGPCEGGGGSTAVLNGGLLFVEDSFQYQSLDGLILNASNGSVAGSFNSPFVPAFGAGNEFLVESSQSGESLDALDPASQTVIWSAPLSGGAAFLLPPFVVNDVVYEESSAGSLIAYSAANGSVIDTYPVRAGSNAAQGMAAGDNLLFVPAQDSLSAFKHK